MEVSEIAYNGSGYRLLFETCESGLLVTDARGKISDANPAACGLLGRPREELTGLRLDDLSDPTYPILGAAREELLVRGGFFVSARLLRPDGSSFPAELSVKGDGDAVGIVLREIGGREEEPREGEESRASAAEYRAMVEGSPDAVAIFDPNNTIRYANPAFERLLGYGPEKLIGLFVPDVVHPEDLARGAAVMAKVHNGRGPAKIPGEFRYRHKKGYWVYLETTLNDLAEDPEVRGFVAVCRDVTERKRAEEQLRESEERFRALAENALDFVVVQRPDNTLSYASPSVKRLLGYEPEEVVGTVGAEYIHPEDLEWAWPVFYRQLETPGINEGVRIRYRHKNGSWRWFESSCNNQLDNPAIEGLVFNCRDVTERVEAEEEVRRLNEELERRVTERTMQLEALIEELQSNQISLRESEERFRATFEQAAVGVAHVGLDGRWLKVNRRLCEIVGYAQEELLGKTFGDITHPDDLETDLEQVRRMLAGEIQTYSMEKRYVKKDGSHVWIELTVSAAREDVGSSSDAPKYFISVVEDISGRKEAQRALRTSEERFRSLVRHASDIVTVLDADGSIRYESPSVEKVLGHEPEALVGRNAFGYVHPDDLQRVHEAFSRGLENRGTGRPVEYRFRHADGSWRYLEGVGTNLLDEPSVKGIVVNSRDVTERRRAEEGMRRSLDMLLAQHEAGRVLGSTLELERIGPSLLEIMQRVSGLAAAVIHVPGPSRRTWRAWHTIGPEDLWRPARDTPEAAAARRLALENEEHSAFRLPRRGKSPGAEIDVSAGVCLPLRVRDRTVGVLEAYGTETLVEEETVGMLSSLANQAASALENARLYRELEKREERLQDLVERLLGSQEEERRRVAYEVHDGLAQVAAAAHQHLQAFTERYPVESERGREELAFVTGLVQRTVGEARRIIANLRPTVLDDFGLAAALSAEVEALRDGGWRVEYEEDLGDGGRLPVAMETALFRVAQEALTNARKHARTKRARLGLRRAGDEVHLEVRDWGSGFDPTSLDARDSGGPGERVGLSGMRERVEILGGELKIGSRPGEGTSISVRVPLPSREEGREDER